MMRMFKKQSAVRTKQTKPRRISDPRQRMIIFQVLVGIGVFAFCAALLAGIWYGTRVKMLTIEVVEVSGGETIPLQSVKEKVEAELSGTYLGIIPRRFAWFYPYEDILSGVGSVKRVKDPVVVRVSRTELHVTFDEYKSFALWCTEKTEDCLLIDTAGYAFTESPRLTGGAFMRYFTLGRTPAIGETITTLDALSNMNEFIRLVRVGGKFAIASVEIDSAKDVFYRISGGGEIKATLTMPASEVYENLIAVLSAEEFVDLAPGNFQYIDLRFGQKVFVNDSLLPVATSSASTTETTFSTSTISAD